MMWQRCAGAWDKGNVHEMKHSALLPLQLAMRQLTTADGRASCNESEREMQMAAMRNLANVSWLLETIDKGPTQAGSSMKQPHRSCKE